jgi:hypothetical protein
MTKKELLKRLEDGPCRVIIDGKLRQLTRVAGSKEQKKAYYDLDTGPNIGVWDIGAAEVTSIQNKDVESMIGHGRDTDAPS